LLSLLRCAGWNTALIGKWHLGNPPEFGPLKCGHPRFFGNLGGVIDDFTHQPHAGARGPRDLWEGEVPVQRIGDSTQLLADEASSCVRAQQPGLPFFPSLHFTAPHCPWVVPEDEAVSRALKDLFHYEGGSLQTYGSMVRWLMLCWCYKSKAQARRGVRDGDFKVLKINDNEFLCDVVQESRDRANLREKHPQVFERLRRRWVEWDGDLLPITDDVCTHGLTADIQADRYLPCRVKRQLPGSP
jgi:hypothetical protein